jgi:hypothetical protein
VTLTDVDLRMEGCVRSRAKLWLGHVSRIERGADERTVVVQWATVAGERDVDGLTFGDPAAAASFEAAATQAWKEWRARFSFTEETFTRWREMLAR